jgi:hypothetical protein
MNAASLAPTDPEAALAWRSNGAAALTALAEQRLSAAGSKDDYEAAAELAESALVANPLDGKAIAVIALARNGEGASTDVEPLMRRAATRSQRDTPIQGWLFNNALNRRDYAAALDHANAILLTSTGLTAEVLNNLQIFMTEPAARTALLARLSQAPPWRAEFLTGLVASDAPPDLIYKLLSDLSVSPNPPTNQEILPLLQRLVREGQFDLAYVMWVQFLPKDQRGVIRYAFNGDFEQPLSFLPFDWTFPSPWTSNPRIVDSGDPKYGRAMRLTFTGRRIDHRIVEKVMTLTPGRYRLSGSARAEDLRGERGLVWRVFCLAKDGANLATTTPPLIGTFPWQDFSIDFEVPAEGCRGQTLRLELPIRAEIERVIGGEVWFDNIVVERQPASAS